MSKLSCRYPDQQDPENSHRTNMTNFFIQSDDDCGGTQLTIALIPEIFINLLTT
jgi:hypothetical protein